MQDTVHCTCPACGRMTRHAVFRERLLAAVLWCQHCFHVTIRPEAEAKAAARRQADAA